MSAQPQDLRIGTLGAARITPPALISPARRVPGVSVVAVAARDRGRAEAFARKHGIPRTHPDYATLIADPEIDAVYNPLPNSHHCEWTIRALEAGKHVLCEKPLAANAAEAERMAEVARSTGRVLVEAFHWRYHPLARRMKEIVTSGELGEVQRLEGSMCVPFLAFRDIRYRYDLAGGSLMDLGCYPVSILRYLAGAEPEVRSARARLASPRIDRCMVAELDFGAGRSGRITCSLFSSSLLRIDVRVRGTRGQMHVLNPVAPQLLHRVRVRTSAGRRSERVAGESTYTHQLRAFARAVAGEESPATNGEHGVANMRVIDAIYRAAGLPLRGA